MDDEVVYEGRFWSAASSALYEGIVIMDALIACDSVRRWISIENGYAAQPKNDVRDNEAIFDFFGKKGKL